MSQFRYVTVFCILALAVFVSTAPVHAATVWWIVPGSANYNTAADWSSGAVPNALDIAIINNGGTVNIDGTVNTNPIDLWVGEYNTGQGRNPSTLSEGPGNVTQSGGTLNINTNLLIGYYTDFSNVAMAGGTYTMTGGTINHVYTNANPAVVTAGNLYVGDLGTGNMAMSGNATVNANNMAMFVGLNRNLKVSTLSLTDNAFINSSNIFDVGVNNGIGLVTMSGNSRITMSNNQSAGRWFTVGGQDSSAQGGIGMMTMTDNASVDLKVGEFNVGMFSLPSGYAGSVGNFTMNGNSSVRTNTWVGIGNYVFGDGTMTMNGGSFTHIVGNGTSVTIGAQGATGVWNHLGGNVYSNSNLALGSDPVGALGPNTSYSKSIVNLNGGTVQVYGVSVPTTLATSGVPYARLNFNGGILQAMGGNATFISKGSSPADFHAYVNAGGANIDTNGYTETITVGLESPLVSPTSMGVSTISASGGSGYLTAPVVKLTGGTGNGATAIATVSGGAITGIIVTNPGVGYTAGDVLQVQLTGVAGSGAVIGTPVLSPSVSGGLTKLGAGTLRLTGMNTYTGPTVVQKGRLILANTTDTTSLFTVQANGTLSGYNYVGYNALPATVATGGTVEPGDPTSLAYTTGTLQLTHLTLADRANLKINIDATGALNAKVSVLQYTDLITSLPVDGGITATGNTVVDLAAANPLAFAPVAPMTVLDYVGTLTGTLSPIAATDTIGTWRVSVAHNAGPKTITASFTNLSLSNYWNGSTSDYNTSGNWVGGIPNSNNAQALFLDSGTTHSVDLSANVTVSSMIFQDTLLSNPYTLDSTLGKTLTFDTNTALTANAQLTNMAGVHEIKVPVTLSQNLRVFTGAAADSLKFSGVLSGANGIFVSGNGALVLSNTNTYSGATILNGGTISAAVLANGGSNSSIGSSSAAASNLVLNAGTFRYTGPSMTGLIAWNRSFTLGGSGGANVYFETANDVDLASTSVINGEGAVNLYKTGAGKLTITNPGAMTLTHGQFHVSNGSVVLDGGANAVYKVEAGQVDTDATGIQYGVNDSGSVWIGDNFTTAGSYTSGNLTMHSGTLQIKGTIMVGSYNGSASDPGGIPSSSLVMDGSSRIEATHMDTGYNSSIGPGDYASKPYIHMSGNSSMVLQNGMWLAEKGGADTTVLMEDYASIEVTNGGTYLINADGAKLNMTMKGHSSITNLGYGFGIERGVARVTLQDFASISMPLNSGANIGYAGDGVDVLYLKDNASLTLGQTYVGRVGTSMGAIIQSGGTFNNIYGPNSTGQAYGDNVTGFVLGAGDPNTANLQNGSYGYYNMSGGTANLQGVVIGGLGIGVWDQSGGTVTTSNTAGFLMIGDNDANTTTGPGRGVVNVTGGTFNMNPNTETILGSNGHAYMTISGTGVINAATQIWLTNSWGATNPAAIAVLNLNTGGTLVTPQLRSGQLTGTLPWTAIMNFNGGTLKPLNASLAATFVQGMTHAYVLPGGAKIDTNTFNVTIPQKLEAPSGLGLAPLLPADFTSGSGYIGAPMIEITSSNLTAVPPTAVAQVELDPANANYGKVIGITVTSPGSGFVSGDTLTFTFSGGVPATGTAATVSTYTFAANASGGLTKNGLGTLTLTGANTYTGTTLVSTGVLQANDAAGLPTASFLDLSGGVFAKQRRCVVAPSHRHVRHDG